MVHTTRSRKHLVLFVCCLLGALQGRSNNIQIANTTLTGNTGTSIQIRFDLSWENSWRGGGAVNWDAAWVFVKYRTSLTGPGNHVRLNNAGHVAAAGSQIDLGLVDPGAGYNATNNPVVGVFIRRDAAGNGNLSLPGTELQWNYGALGLTFNDIAMVQVFAIEMVYVPQGAFAAGSGGTETNAFTLTTINTADVSIVPTGTGSLGGQAGGLPPGQFAIPGWPNGFGAFYSMKYEISQQQYVDFLNTLPRAQQDLHTQSNLAVGVSSVSDRFVMSGTPFVVARNGISCNSSIDANSQILFFCDQNNNGSGGDATDGTDIACNYLGWGDLTAYMDWSGLRPMTELEFEKACRGTLPPSAGEYPWGTTGISSLVPLLSNGGTSSEGFTSGYNTNQGIGNACYSGGSWIGPLRVGIFAADGNNSGRVTSGASYYGIMELGGNLYERPLMLANPGYTFQGTHGNGTLAATGDADVSSWPPAAVNGTINRGGSYTSPTGELRVSNRANLGGVVGRYSNEGSRGVRSAP